MMDERQRAQKRPNKFHRQANDIGERTIDPFDDNVGRFLSRVRTRLVERVHDFQVIVDFSCGKGTKCDCCCEPPSG